MLTMAMNVERFIENAIAEIKRDIQGRAIIGLSGGVDSSVCAMLAQRALGDRLVPVYVDSGLMRQSESDRIEELFKDLGLVRVNAQDRFLDALKGVIDPEEKRMVVGETFIRVFEEEARKIGGDCLIQGTIYPDRIESDGGIKAHHNVGGLPNDLDFELLEPLRELFKDEVRALGRELGLPERLLMRQPFPGPGLAVRIIGEVNEESLAVLRDADVIVQEELRAYEGYGDIWQSFAVLLPVKSVGVMGDERTYANVVALRIVASLDAMTADWVKLPYEVLGKISSRIINEVRGVNRVVYDISSKPPSTIEWE